MPLTNLKPVFYRVQNGLEVRSGWINSATGDICDTEDGDHYRIRVVPQGRAAFSVGQRVEVRETIPLWDGDCLLADERGAIASLDEETGAVEIKLEALHSALDDNTLTLYPFHNEETLACLTLYERKQVQRVEVERSPSLWWAALVFIVVTPMAAMLNMAFDMPSALLIFGVTVMSTSLVLGAAHALILSVLFPVAINLVFLPPALGFQTPTAGEFLRVALYLALSLLVPTLCAKCRDIRKALIEVEAEVVPHRRAKRLN